MNVLLLEPDKILAENYIRALTDRGHSVAWSKTAQDAISRADETCPDVVVLELQIARHNGIEFLYEFISYSEWQHIPVIILTNLSVDKVKRFKMLREELNVVEILSKTHTTIVELQKIVESANQRK